MGLFETKKSKIKAFMYSRHSTKDRQLNSIEIQEEKHHKYAEKFGIEIVSKEEDKETGLVGPEERLGFARILEKCKDPNYKDVKFILVLDESRWGRFENDNAAPHYEFECNKYGKSVLYTADDIPPETQKNQMGFRIYKKVKQEMAFDYSRVLGDKVLYGCKKVSEQCYSAGGTACYGMKRIMIEQDGSRKELKKGQHKAITNARVIFVPANDETTQTVKDIFSYFEDDLSLQQIYNILNENGILSAQGGKWNKDKLIRILTNEIYIGTRIYNKTWSRLRHKSKKNPISEWVIKKEAFEPIIDKELFSRVQEKLYWITRSKVREGTYSMKKAENIFNAELKNFLVTQGVYEDDADYISRKFPVVYAVSIYQSKETKYWCFIIPNNLMKHEFVFGIGVSKEKTDPIDKLFLIPTEDLGRSNIIIFSEKDNQYPKYYIENAKAEIKISSITKELLNN